VRDSQRLELTPGEYADARQRERQRTLRSLLAHLRASRAERWYLEGLATARAGFGETPAPSDQHERGGRPTRRRP